jgi:hypothetical protein
MADQSLTWEEFVAHYKPRLNIHCDVDGYDGFLWPNNSKELVAAFATPRCIWSVIGSSHENATIYDEYHAPDEVGGMTCLGYIITKTPRLPTFEHPLSNDEYANDKGQHCPACGSDAISGGDNDYTDEFCFVELYCGDCESSWVDTYVLKGYKDLVSGV